jgi:hypothetical protein
MRTAEYLVGIVIVALLTITAAFRLNSARNHTGDVREAKRGAAYCS